MKRQEESFKRRIEVGKSFMLLGNLAAGALIFGQSASEGEFDMRLAALGTTVVTLLYLWAWRIMNSRRSR